MANRNLQQKLLKNKRRGKYRNTGATHGKNTVNSGPSIVPNVMSLFRHKLTDSDRDKYLNSKFPGRKAYTDQELKDRYILAGLTSNPEYAVPLGRVKLLLERMQEHLGFTEMHNHFKKKYTPHHMIDIFFSPTKDRWMIVEMKNSAFEKFIRKSSVYSSKGLALQALQLESVRWEETEPLPDLPKNTDPY